MEITLEKIELVKDRTGVSYKEAKEALEANNGDVVDAIIAIEEAIDANNRSGLGESASEIVNKIKTAVKKGNVNKIVISKDGDIIMNLPVNVGIVGTIVAPWAAVAGVLAAFGTKCRIELVKNDGQVVNVNELAEDKFGSAKEKGGDLFDNAKEKGSELFGKAKDLGSDLLHDLKERIDNKDDNK